MARSAQISSSNATPMPATIEKAAVALEGVQTALEGKAVKKIIIVPQRIVNVVA